MRSIFATVHQGGFGARDLLALEAGLKRVYGEQFGSGERVTVVWCELPRGQGFTERHASDVSFAMVEVANGLDQPSREKAMFALANEWARIAGVGIDKLMITLADSSTFRRFVGASRNRIRPGSRAWFLASTIGHLVYSRLRNGYLSIKANL